MKLIVAVCFLFLTTSALAQVYRSVDENGNVVYSDIPPKNVEKTEAVALPEDISKKRRDEAQQDLKQLLDTTNTNTDTATATDTQQESSSAETDTTAQEESVADEPSISDSDQARIEELERQMANTAISRKGSRRKRRNRMMAADSELGSIYDKYGIEYQSQYKGMGFQELDPEKNPKDE